MQSAPYAINVHDRDHGCVREYPCNSARLAWRVMRRLSKRLSRHRHFLHSNRARFSFWLMRRTPIMVRDFQGNPVAGFTNKIVFEID